MGDIVKHKGEVEGKSTAVHAAILAPESVNLYSFPDTPDYSPSTTLLVFPGKNSMSLSQIYSQLQSSRKGAEKGEGGGAEKDEETSGETLEKDAVTGVPVFPFSRVVFLDCTWSQCHGMCQD